MWTSVVCPFHFNPQELLSEFSLLLNVSQLQNVSSCSQVTLILTVLGEPMFRLCFKLMLQQKQFSLFGKENRVEEQKQTLSKGQSQSFIHYSISIYSALIKYPLHASCLLAPGDNGHCLMGLKKGHCESIQ